MNVLLYRYQKQIRQDWLVLLNDQKCNGRTRILHTCPPKVTYPWLRQLLSSTPQLKQLEVESILLPECRTLLATRTFVHPKHPFWWAFLSVHRFQCNWMHLSHVSSQTVELQSYQLPFMLHLAVAHFTCYFFFIFAAFFSVLE